MILRFLKKPIVIEAFQMTESRRWDKSEWPAWLHEAWNEDPDQDGRLFPDPDFPNDPGHDSPAEIRIGTLEGVLAISWDDWIIQGVKGEIYPCKPEIFEATYEAVS